MSATAELDVAIRSLLAGARVPGCSIAVVDRSRTLWSQGFGHADLKHARAAAASTISSILRDEETARQMQTLVAKGRAGIESKVGVGLGWKIGSADGHPFLNHEGGGAGFTSEIRLYPEAGIGVVMAMNLSSMAKTMRVAHRICELLRKHRGSWS